MKRGKRILHVSIIMAVLCSMFVSCEKERNEPYELIDLTEHLCQREWHVQTYSAAGGHEYHSGAEFYIFFATKDTCFIQKVGLINSWEKRPYEIDGIKLKIDWNAYAFTSPFYLVSHEEGKYYEMTNQYEYGWQYKLVLRPKENSVWPTVD